MQYCFIVQFSCYTTEDSYKLIVSISFQILHNGNGEINQHKKRITAQFISRINSI